MKVCNKCQRTKLVSDFSFKNKLKNTLHSWCRECFNLYNKKNQIHCQQCQLILSNKNRTGLCKPCFKQNKKIARENLKITKDFKIKLIEKQCKKCLQLQPISKFKFNFNYYYPDGHDPKCKNCINTYKTSDQIREKNRLFYHKNKKLTNLKQRKKYSKRKLDPIFRLRNTISNSIRTNLKKYLINKNNSTFHYLSYSLEDLKQHLENLFEPWMTWNNYGKYYPNKDTWQIDHIIPQSLLSYSSMKDDNFKKCWALENLRPLKTIDNIRKNNKLGPK